MIRGTIYANPARPKSYEKPKHRWTDDIKAWAGLLSWDSIYAIALKKAFGTVDHVNEVISNW